MTTIVDLISRKRDGQALGRDEIRAFIDSFVKGQVADYQMSAWLMAVFFRGMNVDETTALTEAMLHSGRVLDLSSIAKKKVDKHSTGGVGDKVSLCLAPLVAACGVPVPMVSGRGLGHTGGTLDKLEAIPGFRVDLDVPTFSRVVAEVGTCLIGQTAEIAPADKRIYALRDVTATVECVPLIVASILSKKLAEGIDALVLDVKVGRGAFMKDLAQARTLARALVDVGTAAGKPVVAVLTDMSAPLGLTIGNALETREAIDVLKGQGPADLIECTLVLGAHMLMMGGVATSEDDARAQLNKAISSGAGLDVFRRLIESQHGDARVVDDYTVMPVAPVKIPVLATATGFVTDIDPLELAHCSLELGAGRTRADQAIDHAVGLELQVQRGGAVEAGSTLVTIHARTEAAAERIAARVNSAFTLGATKPSAQSLVIDTLR